MKQNRHRAVFLILPNGSSFKDEPFILLEAKIAQQGSIEMLDTFLKNVTLYTDCQYSQKKTTLWEAC